MEESTQNPNFDNQNFQNYYPAPPIQELRVGFGKRLGVYLLDLVLVVLLGGILSFAIPVRETFLWETSQEQFDTQRSQMEERGMSEEEIDMAMGIGETMAEIGVLAGIVGLLYSLVELFTGASPAKHMFGLIAAHPNGSPGNLALWGVRWFIKNSSSILTVLGMLIGVQLLGTIGSIVGIVIIIGFFFALGEEKQALHDKIAKTAIFHKEDVENMQSQSVVSPAV